MINNKKSKIYIGIIGFIFILISILLALIYAFTFNPTNLMVNDIFGFFSNALFYLGILLLIISGFLFFKDKFL